MPAKQPTAGGEHRGRVVDFTGDNLLAEFAKGLLYKDQAEADRVIDALRRAGLKCRARGEHHDPQ